VSQPATLAQRLTAEALGSALLAAAVIGSGVMAERLAGGNVAIALLANTLTTKAALYALIVAFGSISAQFNPAVTLALLWLRRLPARQALAIVAVQILAMIGGAMLAHAMFGLPLLQIASKTRDGYALVLAEIVATFGLLLVILLVECRRADAVPAAVACWIGAAYWFTASTSFANPAITLARALSDTFAGIAPGNAPGFVLGQALGAALAVAAFRLLRR